MREISAINLRPLDRVVRLSALILALFTTFYISLVQLNGVDFWLLAKLGQITLSNGAIPKTLLFPFTEIATEHFNAHEWFASILFYWGIQALGEQGMAVLAGVLGIGLFLLLARLAHVHSGASLPIALFCGLLGLGTENYRHVIRPELVALFCMAVFWIQYEKLSQTFQWRHFLVAAGATIVWTSVHGSFILAAFIAVMYASGALLDGLRTTHSLRGAFSTPALRLCGAAACIALCTLLNPFGFELIEFAFGFGGNNELGRLIGEWTPTFSTSLLGLRGLWISMAAWLLVFSAVLATRNTLRSVDWMIFFFFTVLAIKAIRFPVFLCFLIPLYLPRALQQWAPNIMFGQRGFVPLALAASLILISAAAFGNAHSAYPLLDVTRTKFTEAMAREVENPAHSGKVLNSMRLGPELIYRSYPRLRPASDCRLDSYGLDYLMYLDAVLHEEKRFHEFVDRYGVQYLLLEMPDFIRFEKFETWTAGEWEIVLLDEKAAFLRRHAP